jgi:hypothetical protein
LVGDTGDKVLVAKFASDLFGEEFCEDNVILGETEPILDLSPESLLPEDYHFLKEILQGDPVEPESRMTGLSTKLGVSLPENEDRTKTVGMLLQRDHRATCLRRLITDNSMEVHEIATQVFADLPDEKQLVALSELIELLLQARDPSSSAPLLSARYHLFLRSLEGAYIAYWPDKKIILDRKVSDRNRVAFEIALCRECGQHYLVGKFRNGQLTEAIRDPGHPDFGATFFRPIVDCSEDDDNGSDETNSKQIFRVCVQCGFMWKASSPPGCKHQGVISVERQETAEEKEDQVPRCSTCGYQAPDPVREVVHGTDGPHAVIATTLYQNLPDERKKVLAFADGRQEASFFAWYLEYSYKEILSRNLLLKVVQRLTPHIQHGLSLREMATDLRNIFYEKNVFPPATGDLQLSREAWHGVYREFLTDEPRISLEGVGLVRWSIRWPSWLKIPEGLLNSPWFLTEAEIRDLVFILLDSMRVDRAVELRTENSVPLNWNDLELQASQMRFRIGAPGRQRGVRSWDGKSGKRVRFLSKLLTKMNTRSISARDN